MESARVTSPVRRHDAPATHVASKKRPRPATQPASVGVPVGVGVGVGDAVSSSDSSGSGSTTRDAGVHTHTHTHTPCRTAPHRKFFAWVLCVCSEELVLSKRNGLAQLRVPAVRLSALRLILCRVHAPGTPPVPVDAVSNIPISCLQGRLAAKLFAEAPRRSRKTAAAMRRAFFEGAPVFALTVLMPRAIAALSSQAGASADGEPLDGPSPVLLLCRMLSWRHSTPSICLRRAPVHRCPTTPRAAPSSSSTPTGKDGRTQ